MSWKDKKVAKKYFAARARSKKFKKGGKARYYKNHAEVLAKYRARHAKRREEQAGRARSLFCEICNEECNTVFDHDHHSGKFRGWLCGYCNRLLGAIECNPGLVYKMYRYLASHQEGLTE